MAKTKTLKGQALKMLRSGLAMLKRAGLFKGNVRSAKGGWRQKALLKKYDDVIAGKAKAIKVGAKDAKEYDKSYRAKNGRVVVKAKPDEKLTYSKKTKTISSKRVEYGVQYRRIVVKAKIRRSNDVPDNPPEGKVWFYKLPHNPLLKRQEIVDLLQRYSHRKGYQGFLDALEIYEIDEDQFPGGVPDDLDPDEIKLIDEIYKPKRTKVGGKAKAARKKKAGK